MQLVVDGQKVDPRHFGVRSLGFGQGVFGRPVVHYECRLQYDELWESIGVELECLVRESLEEAEKGILAPDQQWIVEGWSAADIHERLRSKPDFVRRVLCEIMDQDLLLALFDRGSSAEAVRYVANNLGFLRFVGGEVVFGGGAFLVGASRSSE